MKVLVASTVAPWKQGQGQIAWLANAEAMVEHYGDGFEIDFFLAMEVDKRGTAPLNPLLGRIDYLRHRLGAKFDTWTFSLDDGATEFQSGNRLFRICTGRNAAHEYAMVHGYDAILFLDTDIMPDADCIPKLAEIDHPVVGGNVGAYGMHGEPVEGYDFPVEAHWNTAGFLMLRRQVFTRIAWNYDLDSGNTDDPAFQRNTATMFGSTWVRKDVNGIHVEPLVPVEERKADRKYYR